MRGSCVNGFRGLDAHSALRLGLLGLPPTAPARALAESAAPFAAGPNEEVVLATSRLPGLADPRAAYETGRVLRLIARLFDRARAPAAVGRQFRDNIAAAILAHRGRREGRGWDVVDTVDMFMEVYARVLGEDGRDYDIVRRTLLDYARSRPDGAAAETGAAAGLRAILQGSRAASF